MKTAIVYYSKHHGNTKKLLDAIAKQGDVTFIDASSSQHADLFGYDLIGFASGIYYSKFHDSVLQFAEKNLPHGKRVFLIYTYGMKRKSYTDAIKQIIESKDVQLEGAYGCPGFDTFGPFKLIGGIQKGRPNDEDIAGAVTFFLEIAVPV
ncbi:MAG: flavodoxin family protein [Methanomicrobiales archaeon]|nr:flavodoxin family protein [Methanomicrobiales archaeon]